MDALKATLNGPNQTVAEVARALCNRLVARGNPDFMALLPTFEQPTDPPSDARAPRSS